MGIVRTSVKKTIKGGFNPGKIASVEIKDYADRLEGSYVTVGVHADAGNYPDSENSVADVAFFNEFGTKDVPARSFLRSTVAENEADLQKRGAKVLEELEKKKKTPADALSELGLALQTMIQAKISSDIPPANSAETLKRKLRLKQGTNTLIATRRLLQSITFKVTVPKDSVRDRGDSPHEGGIKELEE